MFFPSRQLAVPFRVEMVLLDCHLWRLFVALASPSLGVAGVGASRPLHLTPRGPSLCLCDDWAQVIVAEPPSLVVIALPHLPLISCPGILLPLWPSIFPGGMYPPSFIYPLWNQILFLCVPPISLQRHHWGGMLTADRSLAQGVGFHRL